MANRTLTIKNEIDADPNGRGYVVMDDQQAADDLNTKYVELDVEAVSASQLQAAVDPDEYETELGGNAEWKRDLWHCVLIAAGGSGGVLVRDPLIRAQIAKLWPAGSASRTNMLALQTTNISRGVELGVGEVSGQDVTDARAA